MKRSREEEKFVTEKHLITAAPWFIGVGLVCHSLYVVIINGAAQENVIGRLLQIIIFTAVWSSRAVVYPSVPEMFFFSLKSKRWLTRNPDSVQTQAVFINTLYH